MYKLIAAISLASFSTSALACGTTLTGKVNDYDNEKKIKVTSNGNSLATKKWGNYWSIRNSVSGDGRMLLFGINMDEATTINGMQFAFHLKKPFQEWKDGYSETFKPFKSLTSKPTDYTLNQFACGGVGNTKHKLTAGYFGSKLIHFPHLLPKGTPAYKAIWHLDSSRSTATLSASSNYLDRTRRGYVKISGTFNLVYVHGISDRWKNGERLANSGETLNLTVKFDDIKLVRE